jgi:hemoglobin-like flavoprotein
MVAVLRLNRDSLVEKLNHHDASGKDKNMKWPLGWFSFCAVVVSTLAQTPVIDHGVANEVARTSMRDTTGQAILANTNLMAQYQNLALEQELVQEAVRKGLTERLDVQQSLHAARRNILIQALRNNVVEETTPPEEDEWVSAYERFSDRLIQPEAMMLDVYTFPGSEMEDLAKARSVLQKNPDKAESLLLEKGFMHFTAGIPEAWFNPSQVSTSVWPRLLEMKSGDVDSFPDGEGLLLVRKMGQREARPMTLDESRGILSELLLREQQDKLWNDYLEQSRKALQP